VLLCYIIVLCCVVCLVDVARCRVGEILLWFQTFFNPNIMISLGIVPCTLQYARLGIDAGMYQDG